MKAAVVLAMVRCTFLTKVLIHGRNDFSMPAKRKSCNVVISLNPLKLNINKHASNALNGSRHAGSVLPISLLFPRLFPPLLP